MEVALCHTNQALSRLEVLAEIAEENGLNDTLIKVLVLKALACDAQGDLKTALKALEGAFSKAAPLTPRSLTSCTSQSTPSNGILHIYIVNWGFIGGRMQCHARKNWVFCNHTVIPY